MSCLRRRNQSSLELGRDEAEDLADRLAEIGEVLGHRLPDRAVSRVRRRALVDDGLPALL
jgi:hypothetical protein